LGEGENGDQKRERKRLNTLSGGKVVCALGEKNHHLGGK